MPQVVFAMQNETNAALKGLAVDSDRGPLITITILDEDKVMTVKEAGSLSMQEFAKFYSVSL